MAFRIGFTAEHPEKKQVATACTELQQTAIPRKSVVQVSFPGHNMPLAYYNDRFDLHPGDMVYVDGKLEGLRGRVTDVNCNFKIRISDYRRVIAVVDTSVNGQLYFAGSHFVAFDRTVLLLSKVGGWFLAPRPEEEEIVSGCDDTTFRLDDLGGMGVGEAIGKRGHQYYLENRVRYLCVDGGRGYAIVEGSENYEVEFEYRDGEIGGLVCSCYCSYNCKHEVAAMLQLRETLELIEKHYRDEYERTGYFAAVEKGALFAFAIAGKETGSLML